MTMLRSIAMTGPELSDCLDALNWRGSDLAQRLRVRHQLIRRWATGKVSIPDNVATWLTKLAAGDSDVGDLPEGWR